MCISWLENIWKGTGPLWGPLRAQWPPSSLSRRSWEPSGLMYTAGWPRKLSDQRGNGSESNIMAAQELVASYSTRLAINKVFSKGCMYLCTCDFSLFIFETFEKKGTFSSLVIMLCYVQNFSWKNYLSNFECGNNNSWHCCYRRSRES